MRWRGTIPSILQRDALRDIGAHCIIQQDPFMDIAGMGLFRAEHGDNQKERKIHRPRQYHYVIGNYNKSTYCKKCLVEDHIRIPGGMTTTVHLQTALPRSKEQISNLVLHAIVQG